MAYQKGRGSEGGRDHGSHEGCFLPSRTIVFVWIAMMRNHPSLTTKFSERFIRRTKIINPIRPRDTIISSHARIVIAATRPHKHRHS